MSERKKPKIRQLDPKDRKNTFVDKGLRNKDPIDKILYTGPVSDRGLNQSTLIKIQCIKCNRTFNVSKSLIRNNEYMCDSCITKKSR